MTLSGSGLWSGKPPAAMPMMQATLTILCSSVVLGRGQGGGGGGGGGRLREGVCEKIHPLPLPPIHTVRSEKVVVLAKGVEVEAGMLGQGARVKAESHANGMGVGGQIQVLSLARDGGQQQITKVLHALVAKDIAHRLHRHHLGMGWGKGEWGGVEEDVWVWEQQSSTLTSSGGNELASSSKRGFTRLSQCSDSGAFSCTDRCDPMLSRGRAPGSVWGARERGRALSHVQCCNVGRN